MSSNHLIVKVHSESHAMPESKFWLGFIIYHAKKNKADFFEPCVSSLEIISLKLSINNRRLDDFYYPIDIRNEFRLQVDLLHQYLIEAKDFTAAFNKYESIRKIDFLIGTKNKESILKNNGLGFVEFIFDDYKKNMIIYFDYIEKNPKSYLSLLYFNKLSPFATTEPDRIKKLFNNLDPSIKNSTIGKKLGEAINKMPSRWSISCCKHVAIIPSMASSCTLPSRSCQRARMADGLSTSAY